MTDEHPGDGRNRDAVPPRPTDGAGPDGSGHLPVASPAADGAGASAGPGDTDSAVSAHRTGRADVAAPAPTAPGDTDRGAIAPHADSTESAHRTDRTDRTDRTHRTDRTPAPTDDRVGSRDGGVTRRLSRRCGIAAVSLFGLTALCLVVVVVRERSLLSAVLTLVAWAAGMGAIVMWRRWVLWTAVSGAEVPAGAGIPATSGQPNAVSPGSTGKPIKRRFGAMVLPIRADSGATPGGGALVVHARADGAAPAAGDRVRVVPIAGRGDPTAPGTDPRSAVRVLLLRDSDGAMFVATTRVSDTW